MIVAELEARAPGAAREDAALELVIATNAGMRFRTDVPRRIAVVPAGYADDLTEGAITTPCVTPGIGLLPAASLSRSP